MRAIDAALMAMPAGAIRAMMKKMIAQRSIRKPLGKRMKIKRKI